MAVNKVICNNTTIIDLTQDTVTSNDVRKDCSYHYKDGQMMIGTCKTMELKPLYYDYNIGYIQTGTWIYENPTNTYTDIYSVFANHTYFLTLGGTVGSRFRSMFTTVDITTITSGRITGTQIINYNNPTPYEKAYFTPTQDGYILVAKDNVGVSGLKTYLYDATEGWL